MRRLAVWSVTIFVSVFLSSVSLVPAAGQASLVGSYKVAGQNANGSTYAGTVKITKSGDVYLLAWTIGGQTHTGIAIVDGNTLASSWAIRGSNTHGVVVYRIDGNRLVGRWAQSGGTRLGRETLTRLP